MNLSKETTEILKNFAEINPSLLFQPGNVQKTVSPQKTILVKANLKESFDKEFAMVELSQFISVLSLYDNPVLKFHSEELEISNSDGVARTTLRYGSPSLVQSPPNKEINLPSSEVSFTIKGVAMQTALRQAGVLNLPDIALVGRNGKAYLSAVDASAKQSGNKFEYEVGETNVNYMMVFKIDNLKLLTRDYDVRVSTKGISHFKSKTGDIEYWIAIEQNLSKYGD